MDRGDDENPVVEDELAYLHGRLDRHFAELHSRRRLDGASVFAIEHGLSGPELALLKDAVIDSIKRGLVRRAEWLPLLVYATEIGYDYSGDEYWQTFESLTPGWVERGDRPYIRQRFAEFRSEYGGAQPGGPWARQFSIICWPITHAVLPTDLQRHLAHLLFDYRRALTSNLLADPDELGKHLAARSWHASSRFRNFAQNSSLLGRVAAALLTGEGEHSPYLLDSTLRRIVNDLSEERQARSWLRSAKSTAARVQLRGFKLAAPGGAGGAHRAGLPPSADPDLTLRRSAEGWAVQVELPDLSVLAARFPELGDELSYRRGQVAGVSSPLARGLLLYPGQRIRLTDWPASDISFIQLEGAPPELNELLSDQCVLAPGSSWLFRVRDSGIASEVRGNHVRPGREYVLLSKDALPIDPPPWIAETSMNTRGVQAFAIETPSVLDATHMDVLRAIGVGVLTEVEIRPAGLVPARWDGEGRAEWLAGERPVLAVSSSRTATESVWALDGHAHRVVWPPEAQEVFVALERLEAGSHDLQISLVRGDEQVAEGAFEIRVRPPQTRATGGTFRQGLMIIATPVNPSLTELWDGDVALEVRGPTDIQIAVEVSLRDRSGLTLVRRECQASLPIATDQWTSLLERLLRQDRAVQKVYEDAETGTIRISQASLGEVFLRCEREFSPLRWISATDNEGPFLRLVDHTEGAPVRVEVFEFSRPDRGKVHQLDERACLRPGVGGLVAAGVGSTTAAMILPPPVRHLEDLRVNPRLSTGTRSLLGVMQLIDLAKRWATASRPSDPFAEWGRVKVLRAIASQMAGLIGGEHWTKLEQRNARDEGGVPIADFQEAVGRQPHHRALARDVARWISGPSLVQPEDLVESLATALTPPGRSGSFRPEEHRFAEFLLRLASSPESLGSWPHQQLEAYVQRVLNGPMLLRAARFLVIAIDAPGERSASAKFGGWVWP